MIPIDMYALSHSILVLSVNPSGPGGVQASKQAGMNRRTVEGNASPSVPAC